MKPLTPLTERLRPLFKEFFPFRVALYRHVISLIGDLGVTAQAAHEVYAGLMTVGSGFAFRDGRPGDPLAQTRVDASPLRCHLPRAPRALEALLQSRLNRSAAARPAVKTRLAALHRFIRTVPTMRPVSNDPTPKTVPLPFLKGI